MSRFRILFSAIFLIIIAFSVPGKAQFYVDAQLRPRAEFRNGYTQLAAKGSVPAFIVSQRSRLTFGYESEKLKIIFTPQDVRFWGDEPVLSSTGVGDNPSLCMFEAFAELKMGKAAWLKVGRQQLSYDSKRLLGDRNWNQNGIAYDAVVAKFALQNFNLHLGGSWNTLIDKPINNFHPSNRIKSLGFIWLNRNFNEHLSASFLCISSGYTKTDTTNSMYFKQTSGFFAEYRKGCFNTWGNIYYQFGRNQSGNELSAFLLDAEASFRIEKFTPGAGLGYLSGNHKNMGPGITDHLFDPLYGNRHRYFGSMDYFRNIPKDTRQGGLTDIFLWLDYRFPKKTSLRNTLHYFSLAQSNPTTPVDKTLGFENDLILKYKFNTWGELEGGYCFFLPCETLKTMQNVQQDTFSHFFYLLLTISPNLFKLPAEVQQ